MKTKGTGKKAMGTSARATPRAVAEEVLQEPVPAKKRPQERVFAEKILKGNVPAVEIPPEEEELMEEYEQTITDLRQQLDIMVRKNPFPMLLTDPEFAIIEANAAYLEMTGIPEQELLKTNIRDFTVTAHSGEGAKVALKEKRRAFGTITLTLPSGVHVLEQYCIPVLSTDSKITSLLFVYNDITAKEKKNEEIDRLKFRSDTIVQQNPMPIIIVDPAFRIRMVNEAYVTLSGMEKAKLLDMSLRDFKILEQTGEGLKQVIQENKRSVGEVLVQFPNVSRRLQQFGIPIHDTHGNLESILIVYNDVTEERASQEQLAKKMEEATLLKKRSDTIVNQNPMPIILMDHSFKILMANEAYVTLTGIPKEQLKGKSARDFKIIGQKGEGLKKVIAEKKRSLGEVTIEFPSGVRTLEQYGIPMLDAQQNISTILCVYNDVTMQREQQQKIQAMMEETKTSAELLAASAGDLQDGMARIASGDLTQRVSIDEADPLVTLKKDYNTSVESILTVLAKLIQSVIKLDTTVQDTIRSTEEIAKATEQVAVSSQKATEDAKSQMASIEKISGEIAEISASVEEIASTTHDVMIHAEKAAREGVQAAESGKLATGKMQAVEKISRQSFDEMTDLNEQMQQISKIVNLITDIANQTNLLALNAAIEAARAGEHGRGFAVVAGEVKNLAQESKKASSQIEGLIKTIQGKSQVTTSSMKHSFEEIKTGIESVNTTVELLNGIVSEAKVVSQGVSEITKATEDQARATTTLLAGIESVRTLTRDNQNRMEDMAALAEETSASTEEIASASQEVSAMADQSRKMIGEFKI